MTYFRVVATFVLAAVGITSASETLEPAVKEDRGPNSESHLRRRLPCVSDDEKYICVVPIYEEEVVQLVNQQRAAHGKSMLYHDSDITKVARDYNYVMCQLNCGWSCGHEADGTTHIERLNAAGIQYLYGQAGECISYRYSPNEVVAGWMNSPAHREILLSDGTHFGVGHRICGRDANDSVTYWTLDIVKKY